MQTYDYLVVALLIATVLWGARRGFVKQLASLLSIVLGYIAAVSFREDVASLIQAPHPWNNFAAMLGLFIGASLLVWIAFRFVNGSIEKAGLTSFDTQIGALFGALKGGLLAILMTMFAVVMLGESSRDAVLGSTSGRKICQFIHRAQQLVPHEWQTAMRPYLEQVPVVPDAVASSPTIEEALFDDPFAAASPNDRPAFTDELELGSDSLGVPSFDELRNAPSPQQQPSNYPQATLRPPVFDR